MLAHWNYIVSILEVKMQMIRLSTNQRPIREAVVFLIQPGNGDGDDDGDDGYDNWNWNFKVESLSRWWGQSLCIVHIILNGWYVFPYICTVIYVQIFCKKVISPQSERSELGAFLFLSRGSKWLLLCVLEWLLLCVKKRGYWDAVSYRGSSEMSQIHVQRWHFSRQLVTVDFDDGFNKKRC